MTTSADTGGSRDGAVVTCRSLCKTYRVGWRRRAVEALRGVDLAVAPGEVVGLLGPNGSGKTTLMKVLLGLAGVSSGEATVFGVRPGSAAARQRIGFMPEDNDFHDFLTIDETLQLHGRLVGLDRATIRQRGAELIDLLGLESHRGPLRTLSKGTVRKAALAAALIGNPDLLLLDEPTSGIDPLVSRDVTAEIERRRQAGTTVLLSSHLLADVERLCDRLVVLFRGERICEGRTADLLTREGETEVCFRDLPEAALTTLREAAEREGATLVGSGPRRDDLQSFFMRLLDSRGVS